MLELRSTPYTFNQSTILLGVCVRGYRKFVGVGLKLVLLQPILLVSFVTSLILPFSHFTAIFIFVMF